MIEIKNIYFAYGRKENVLSDLTLTLEQGCIHGLLGCNGMGKTTLIKLISGLLLPKKGSIMVDSHDPARRLPAFFREMFLIPEEFDLPHVSFDGFVKHSAVFYPAFSRDMLDSYAVELNINRSAHLDRMSMGERKKAYLAFALACQPAYLFMDEPTNGLDIPSKPVFKSLLSSFISPERTIIISTHQVADIKNLVDNIVIMDKEGVVLNETTQRIGERFRFGIMDNEADAIWSKESLSGRTGVSENSSGKDCIVDIEMLFNAVINNKERVTEILKR